MEERSAQHAAPASIDRRVREEMEDRFRSMMRAALVAVPLTVPVMVAVLWVRVDHPELLAVWAGVAGVAAAVQWLMYRGDAASPDWIGSAVVMQSIAGVLWGLFPAAAASSDPVWQMVAGQILIGVCAGAAIFASSVRVLFYPFVVPAMLVGAVSYAASSSGGARWVSVLIVAMGIFYVWLAHHLRLGQERTAALRGQLELAATTDQLTGLANRRHFVAELDAALGQGRPGVLFIDLDRFKPVNDDHGHQVGDEVLAIVARRIERVLRSDQVAARLGGDEFTVLITDGEPHVLESLARRIVTAVAQPISTSGVSVSIGASVGGSIAEDGQTAAQLLNAADRAQYDAKRAGGGLRVERLRAVN